MKIALFSNSDWYMYQFNLSLAISLRHRGHEIILITTSGPYVQNLIEHGFRCICIPLERKSINPFKEIATIKSLTTILRNEKFNLLHSFAIKCVIYGFIAAIFAGLRERVNTISGLGYIFSSEDWRALILRPFVTILLLIALAGRKSRLIVLNHEDKIFFLNAKLVPLKKISLIYGAGVDTKKFSPSCQVRLGNKFKVLLIARLLKDKGVLEFIEASKLLEKYNDIEFILAGDIDHGNPASISKQLILNSIKDNNLHWMGHVGDISALLKQVNLVVLPSYREGLPTCLVEAASSAIPIIATNVPGCKEVVENNANGFLIPIRDPKALASSILTLYRDHDLCERFGRNSRDRALKYFDVRIINDQIAEVYREILHS